MTANTTLSDLLKQPKLKSVIESLPYIVGEFNQELPIRALRSFKGIDNAQMDDLIQTLNDFLF